MFATIRHRIDKKNEDKMHGKFNYNFLYYRCMYEYCLVIRLLL